MLLVPRRMQTKRCRTTDVDCLRKKAKSLWPFVILVAASAHGKGLSSSTQNWTSCAAGVWRDTPDRPPPYILAGNLNSTLGDKYLAGFREGSYQHWGAAERHSGQKDWEPCDGGVKYEWESACAARGRVGAFPAAGRWTVAARAFCAQFDGAHVLFVGDSLMGEMFTSFLHLLGAFRGTVVDGGKCGYQGGSNEVLIRAKVCSRFAGNVTAEFIRNDLLDLPMVHKEEFGIHKHLCPFANQAETADLVVINRGMHIAGYQRDDVATQAYHDELGALLPNLVRVRARRGLESRSVVFRSTHASALPCPLNATPMQEPLELPKDRSHYSWALIARLNDHDRALAEENGVSYLDVFAMSSMRPGGRRGSGKGDCCHFCLPGQLDDWNVLLFDLLSGFPEDFARKGVRASRR